MAKLKGDAKGNYLNGGKSADTLYGEAGDDILEGGAKGDTLSGGSGFDLASYRSAKKGVIANLQSPSKNTGDAKGDRFQKIEGLIGSDFNDILYGNQGENILEGGKGNDTLYGGPKGKSSSKKTIRDTLYGNAGNDRLLAGEGVDAISGGLGNDTLSYVFAKKNGVVVNLETGKGGGFGYSQGDLYEEIENIDGSNLKDVLVGDSFSNIIRGFAGDDLIRGGSGADKINGGSGLDRVTYDNSEKSVSVSFVSGKGSGGDAAGDSFAEVENADGSAFDDRLEGNDLNNILKGLEGNDYLYARNGKDQLIGGGGDDFLQAGYGVQYYDGGKGSDTLSYADFKDNSIVDLNHGANRSGETKKDVIDEIENLIGGAGKDKFYGNDFANSFFGGADNDLLEGRKGDDILEGGAGADILNGGAGSDFASYAGSSSFVTINLSKGTGTGKDAVGDKYISIENVIGSKAKDTLIGNGKANILKGGAGNDALTGDAGNDTLNGGIGADILSGGSGVDTASYRDAAFGVKVSLQDRKGLAGEASKDVFSSIENLEGSLFDDILLGDKFSNLMKGLDGKDIIEGGIGNDKLFGNQGNDTITGGVGADYLDGGEDFDIVSYYNAKSSVRADLGKKRGFAGDAKGDRYVAIEQITGSKFNDTLTDAIGLISRLLGGKGNDTLTSRAFADGGEGNDRLIAGKGGYNVMQGGKGSDQFIWNKKSDLQIEGSKVDTVLDFTIGKDKMDFSKISGLAAQDISITLNKSRGGFFEVRFDDDSRAGVNVFTDRDRVLTVKDFKF